MASTGRFSYFKDTSCDNVQIRARLSVSEDSPFSAKWFLQSRGLSISTNTRTVVPKVQSEEMIRLQDLLAEMEELFELTGVRSSL